MQDFCGYPGWCIIPVEESESLSLVSVVGYGKPDASEASGASDWTKSIMLFLSQADGEWKIDLDPVETARIQGMAQADLFPEGYRQAMESGTQNYMMADFFNYMYLDPEAVYADCFTSQAKFFWQDEENDLYLVLFFTNDTRRMSWSPTWRYVLRMRSLERSCGRIWREKCLWRQARTSCPPSASLHRSWILKCAPADGPARLTPWWSMY